MVGDQYATSEADVSAVASGFDVAWARAREMAIEERRYSDIVGTRMVGITSKVYERTGVGRARSLPWFCKWFHQRRLQGTDV